MQNLGSVLFVVVLLSTALFGGVKAKLSPSVAYKGDVVTYSIAISGSDIEKPQVYQVCGENIIASGSNTSLEMIGTSYKKTYTLTYQFIAQKSCTVDPIGVEIDGKTEYTKPLKLTVKKLSAQSGQDFLLEYNASKTELYVGESVDVVLTLKQKHSASVVDSRFVPSTFQGFWKKAESKPKRYDDGEYLVTQVHYTLAPQREGNLTITPAQLQIASRVPSRSYAPSFMPQVQWRSYFSNELHLYAKPLPNGVKYIGDFTIAATTDKRTIHKGEALNVVVRVQGDGNLEDIESFKPYIDGVNVFDEKIQIQGNTLTQKLTFVAEHDFSVPSFELRYFDVKSQQIKTIQTDPITVKVLGGAAVTQKPLEIKKSESSGGEEEVQQTKSTNKKGDSIDLLMGFFLFIAGIIVGVGIMVLKSMIELKPNKKTTMPKDHKQLLVKLLQYKEEDEEVRSIVEKLEKNLYEGANETIDKKKLKEILKRYDIS